LYFASLFIIDNASDPLTAWVPEDDTNSAFSSHAAFVQQPSGQRPGDITRSAAQENILEDSQIEFTEVGTDTRASDLKAHIMETKDNKSTYYTCGYPGCSDASRFGTRKKIIYHIRRVHLMAKRFKCRKWYACLEREP